MNKQELQILNENVVVDTFIVYQFLRRLVTPFNQWEAFKLGIIDDKGNILRRRNTLRTSQERNSFSLFDLMILKMKRVLERLPFGRSRLASYAAALYFIKESNNFDEDHYNNDEDIFAEFMEDFIEELKDHPEEMKKFIDMINDDILDDKYIEEVPTNNIGSGHIAGVNPPKVNRKPKILRRKEDEKNN